jgi:DNA uptake protein ComE-like DNA-binding protein
VKISLPVIAFAAYCTTVGCVAAAADKDPAGSPTESKGNVKAENKGKAKASSAKTSKGSKIDINTAAEEALRKLEDINEERAKAIIDNRCYGATEELRDRNILTERVYDKIKDQLTASKCTVSPSQ